MNVLGRWRIIAMPDYVEDYPDMMEPAYILFDDKSGGEFAFGCVTGQILGKRHSKATEFQWSGNDEMDHAQGSGWAELQTDGSLKGQICFQNGDEANFIAQRDTSSTAC